MEILKEKILVIQTAFIGDAILTLPLLEKLKNIFSHSEIDVIAITKTSEIFSASPFVNEVFILDKKGKHKSFLSLKNYAIHLKEKKYTLVFSPHRSIRTSLLVFFLGIKNSTGFSNSRLSFVYNNVVDYNFNLHEVKRNLMLAENEVNGNKELLLPKLNISNSIKNKIENFLSEISPAKNYIAISPGSNWETKKYPVEYFKVICDYFYKKDFSVFLIGSESEINLCNEIAKEFESKIFNLSGKFLILETIELLKNCKLLITNDSAPTHFGMCADIPVLTIYCSTIPEFGFYPYNNKSKYISIDGLYCKPCGIHGHNDCPLNHFNCGKQLKPNLVIEKIEEILNG